jgi:putative DNA primase/helicase
LHAAVDGRCSCLNVECESPGKHPRTAHGVKDATTDEAQIRTWWERWPEANIGIATGAKSGLVVVDVDGPKGEAALKGLGLELSPTLAVLTGRGRHLWFAGPNGAPTKTLAPGLDVRGDGAYVVVPPSLHFTGRHYEYSGLDPVAPIPLQLLELLQPSAVGSPAQNDEGDSKIPEGRRNTTLTRLAGAMRRRGMSGCAIRAALLEENEQRCDPPLTESEVQRIAASVARYTPAAATTVRVAGETITATIGLSSSLEDWPDPPPLGDELPPVPEFPIELLPESLRPLIADTSERTQTPPDFAAAAAIVALAGCVNRRALIVPKREDTSWSVVPNLWGAIVAPPGMMKSPILRSMTLPLVRLEEDWRLDFDGAKASFDLEKEQSELRWQAWREEYKRAIKKGDTEPIQPDPTLDEPTRRRLVLTDATPEKLHEILAENPAGVLIVRDELTGWLAELEREGRQGERAFFLQAWNGDGGFTIDRIGRGSIYVPAVCVSLIGNIQPARLRAFLSQVDEGPGDDGLFQRLQVLVWPDLPPAWRLIDRAPNQHALQTAEQVFRCLAGATADAPMRMRFDPDAQELFFAWWSELESRIRDGSALAPTFIGHLAKYRSLMPTLAGLFEVADQAAAATLSGEVLISLDHAKNAAALCDFLEAHARRVYACVVSPEIRSARELARHIQAGDLPSPFTTRSAYLKGWAALDTPERIRGPLQLLESAGWVRLLEPSSTPNGGRPSEAWLISRNVKVRT